MGVTGKVTRLVDPTSTGRARRAAENDLRSAEFAYKNALKAHASAEEVLRERGRLLERARARLSSLND